MFKRPDKPSSRMAKESLTPIFTAKQLLETSNRPISINRIKDASYLDDARISTICLPLIENIANHCQSLPETSNHYYAQSGGLLDHALKRCEIAVELFRQYSVLENDKFSEEQLLWLYALLSASLLQGIGKLQIDFNIKLFDIHGAAIKTFNPLLDKLNGKGFYTHEFTDESFEEVRANINILLAKTLMPEEGFAWIASNREVLITWLALLHEDWPAAGSLGAILLYADSLAIHDYFKELLKNHLEKQNSLSRIGTFIDNAQETLEQKERILGIQFLEWLKKSLESGQLTINKEPVFLVPNGLVMSSEIFKLFLSSHPHVRQWQTVKRGFITLGLHVGGVEGEVVSKYHHGNNEVSGLLINKFAAFLPNTVKIYNSTTNTKNTVNTIDLINATISNTKPQTVTNIALTKQLNAKGQWQNLSEAQNNLITGSKFNG